jgi:predicted dehydrogenase
MTIGIGVIGLGGMGAAHLKTAAAAECCRVVAVCDVRPEQLAGDWAKAKSNIDTGGAQPADLSGVKTCTDYRKLLRNKEIDAVVVATPTFLHGKIALAALKAGKHVFCEKPMALTSRESWRMAAAAEAAGTFLVIGHVLRHWPEYRLLKEMIDSGRYGRVRGAKLHRAGAKPGWSWEDWYNRAEMSGGCAHDLHIHDVDVAQWFFGQPGAVWSRGVQTPAGGVCEIVTSYVYDGGPMVTAAAAWYEGPFPFNMGAVISFESAVAVYDMSHSPTLVVYKADGSKDVPAVEAGNPYAHELNYFLKCVASGTRPAVIAPEEAARAVEIAETEIKSVFRGRPVKLG